MFQLKKCVALALCLALSNCSHSPPKNQPHHRLGERQSKGPPFVFTPRVPQATRERLLSDIQTLRNLKGGVTSRLHGLVFGPSARILSGEAYYNFLIRRIAVVDVEPSQKGFFVTAGGSRSPGKLFVTQEYENFENKMSQVERWAVLIHEARHNEPSNEWPHTKCPDPFVDDKGKEIVAPWGERLAGNFACDTEALGSYGVTAIFSRNLELHCNDCSQEVKNQAGSYGRQMLLRITDSNAKKILLNDLYPETLAERSFPLQF